MVPLYLYDYLKMDIRTAIQRTNTISDSEFKNSIASKLKEALELTDKARQEDLGWEE